MNDTDLLSRALADSSRRRLLDLRNANDAQTLSELCPHPEMPRQAIMLRNGVASGGQPAAARPRGWRKPHLHDSVPTREIHDRCTSRSDRSGIEALRDPKCRPEGATCG